MQEENKNKAQQENKSENQETQNLSQEDFQKELDKQKEYYLRIIADCEDRMKRTKQDAIHSINLAIENIAKDLLPLITDINQAINIAEDKTKNGLYLMEKNLHNILKKYGIEKIEAEIGQDFDANLHHAISAHEEEGMEEGKILSIVQTGYKLKDKVISATMVTVTK